MKKFTREAPVGFNEVKTPDDLGIQIFQHEDELRAMLFKGKQKRPLWHYRFKTIERRDDFITKEIQMYQKRLDDKIATDAADKLRVAELVKTIKVGDIFNYSWGWEQTNQNFYQVIEKKSAMTFIVREIGCESLEECSWASDYVRPVKDSFLKNSVNETVRINKYGGFRRSCGSANKVENPETSKHYRSWYA